MELLRSEIINITRYKPEIGLGYYNDLLKIIDDHHEMKPDISIETCKAIIEGICKLVIHRIEQDPLHSLDSFEIKELTKRALTSLNERVQIFDQDFVRSIVNVIRVLGEIRNKHCDIGHGRASLKEQLNDQDLSEMISRFTESIAIYLLKKLDQASESENNYDSEQMQEFNSWLDNEELDFPIQTARYSRVLFDYDNDLYNIRYEEYIKEIDEENSELEEELNEEFKEEIELLKTKQETKTVEPIKTESRYFSEESQINDISNFIIKHKLDKDKFMPELENYFLTNERPSRQKLSEFFLDSVPKDQIKAEAEILEAALQQLIVNLTFL